MKIDSIYTKGTRQTNEDAIVVNNSQDIYAVIDGATGLGGLSGSIAANIVKRNLDNPSSLSLLDRVLEGNNELRKEVELTSGEDKVKIDDIPKFKRSSCGLVAIKFHRNESGQPVLLEYVSAGDCMLFIQFRDSLIRQVTYDHLDRLDQIAISYIQTKWEIELQNIEDIYTLPVEQLKEKQIQFRNEVQEQLQTNRNKLNTFEGYGIVDGDYNVEQFLEYGKIPFIDIEKVLLLSDGLKLHTHRNAKKPETWLSTAKYAFEHGLEQLEKHINEIEESDPVCVNYPRLKQHDDKSGIVINL